MKKLIITAALFGCAFAVGFGAREKEVEALPPGGGGGGGGGTTGCPYCHRLQCGIGTIGGTSCEIKIVNFRLVCEETGNCTSGL